MTFRIAARIATPAVGRALDVKDDLGTSCLCSGTMRASIGDKEVARLSFSPADLIRLSKELVECGSSNRAYHNHGSTEGQLRELNRALITDSEAMLLEAKRPA
jgi:hypothetical protein